MNRALILADCIESIRTGDVVRIFYSNNTAFLSFLLCLLFLNSFSARENFLSLCEAEN